MRQEDGGRRLRGGARVVELPPEPSRWTRVRSSPLPRFLQSNDVAQVSQASQGLPSSTLDFNLACMGSASGCPCNCTFNVDPGCTCRDLNKRIQVGASAGGHGAPCSPPPALARPVRAFVAGGLATPAPRASLPNCCTRGPGSAHRRFLSKRARRTMCSQCRTGGPSPTTAPSLQSSPRTAWTAEWVAVQRLWFSAAAGCPGAHHVRDSNQPAGAFSGLLLNTCWVGCTWSAGSRALEAWGSSLTPTACNPCRLTPTTQTLPAVGTSQLNGSILRQNSLTTSRLRLPNGSTRPSRGAMNSGG
jgi:hypothetical protein